jgi:hypothetical protein
VKPQANVIFINLFPRYLAQSRSGVKCQGFEPVGGQCLVLLCWDLCDEPDDDGRCKMQLDFEKSNPTLRTIKKTFNGPMNCSTV